MSKKHKIISITSTIIWGICVTTMTILDFLGLTSKSNYTWYELLISLPMTITTYIIAWYFGYTHKEKSKNDKNM